MSTSQLKWSKIGWSFVVAWALFVPIGQSISRGLVTILFGNLLNLPNSPVSYLLLFLVNSLIGAGIGLTQWFLLRSWHYKNGWWILATSFGWAVGVLVDAFTMPFFARSSPLFLILSRVMLLSLPGIVVGIPQWLLLKQIVLRAFLWILISAGAWIGTSLFVTFISDPTYLTLVPTIAFGISGIGLVWLLRHPIVR